MKTPDKLYDKIKNAAQNQEQLSFDQKEKVWSAVTDKLNRKKRKTMIFYKSLSAAAVIAVIIFAGIQFSNNQNPLNENPIINRDVPIDDNKNTPIVVDSEKEKPINDNKTTVDSADKKTTEIAEESTTNPKKQESQDTNQSIIATVEDDVAEIEEDVAEIEEDTMPTLPSKDIIVASAEPKKEKSKEEATQTKNTKNITTNAKLADTKNMLTGHVYDKDALTLVGVNVIIKGTTNGTQTDFDGKFSIEVKKGQTLVFSYVGYKTKDIKIKDQKTLEVYLEPSMEALNEVVVSAYGNKAKKSNIRSVNDTETSGNVSNVVQGRVAGVNINSISNTPRYDKNIKIRGLGSITGQSQPLYIVDGKPVNSKDLGNINPNKIESLKVLKDANATAIYGNQGKNGVILILTKDANLKEKKAFDSIARTISYPVKPNNEDYETFKENPFTSPLSEPLSTFSIDVDRAAYTNIRRMINNGQSVPKDAVRIEEMLNFFEYDYDKPQSKHPFAIHTTYSDAPWNNNHKLLKIALQGKDVPKENLPASNLVFLIDVSGSMSNQNKLPLVKKSLKLLTDQMRDEDKIALVTYAGNSQVVLEPTSGNKKNKIKNAIDQLSSGGSTYASQGIETAYALAEENFVKNGNNRVIIATDGDFNIGVTGNQSLEDLIAKKRKTNIFLTCLGYGMGNYKDSKMQSLSQKGNGNYAYIDTYQEAQKFLEREFKGSLYAIAKDVKIQIEFNPKHVQSYRLIGYETRMLADRDFDDDTKDAGEIGVNHQVTALYEVVPRGVDSPFGEFKPDLKYQKVEEPNFEGYSDELATVKFRYKQPDSDTSSKIERIIKNESVNLKNADGDFKFATAVAWFGLKLRDSKLISHAEKSEIIDLAKQGLDNDKEGYRAEFIRLVRLSE